MSISLPNLIIFYGEAGAREQFERLCSLLIKTEYPSARAVRVHQGDGGVDTSVGDWDGSSPVTVFQQKYFPGRLGDDQKKQIRDAYTTARQNTLFAMSEWVLCLPINLSGPEQAWWDKWRGKQDRTIKLWDALAIERMLLDPKNRGIKEEFFRLQPESGDVDEAGRVERLQGLRRASLARSIERWQAAGVSRSQARQLAEDTSVGQPSSFMIPDADKPLVLLVGELGAGKSLFGERIHQLDIERAEGDASAPIPIYLKVRDIATTLDQTSRTAAEGLGEPAKQGGAIVIDGADEAGLALAVSLLTQSRTLVEQWPDTTVVITSRPIPEYGKAEEAFRVPLLSIQDSYALMSRVVGEAADEGGIVHNAAFRIQESTSITDAIERPLFAILTGVYLKDMSKGRRFSRVELLEHLVERSLGGIGIAPERATTLLERLAVQSIDRGGQPVPKHEVAQGHDLQALLGTRLVVEHSGNLSFPLSLLVEWFAARGLASDSPTPAELIADPQRLERWRFALITYLGTSSVDVATKLLDPLVRANPGMASSLIATGLTSWGMRDTFALPSALECGRQVQQAMAAWEEGLGPLASLCVPFDFDGNLAALAVATHPNGYLQTAWYHVDEGTPRVFEFTQDMLYQMNASLRSGGPDPPGFVSYNSGTPTNVPAWAWKWTLDKLNATLWNGPLSHFDLPLIDGPLVRESAWRTALALLDNRDETYTEIRHNPDGPPYEIRVYKGGWMDQSPIPFDQLDQMLSRYRDPYYQRRPRSDSFNLDHLRIEMAHARAMGKTELTSPWPIADREYFDGLRGDWDLFSPEQILARAMAIYGGALDGYQQLVALWFPRLAPRLAHLVLLPATLRAIISVPQKEEVSSNSRLVGPAITYYFEPLPSGSVSSVDFRLGTKAERYNREWEDSIFAEMGDKLRRLRPLADAWLYPTITQSVLDIFYISDDDKRAATLLAYRWLTKDLELIGWSRHRS